jgi:hypothetical protein
MCQDYKDLLSAFHAHGVRYLIVDGHAVIYHRQPRYTKDIASSSQGRFRKRNSNLGRARRVRGAAPGHCP